MTTTKGMILGLLLVAFCAAQANSSVINAATIRVMTSSATGEGPVYTVDIDTSTGEYTENADGTATWVGSLETEMFDLGWNYVYDPDPGVSGNLTMTNNLAAPQFFSVATGGVPSTVSAPAGSPMNGSSTISVADSDFSNTPATIASPSGGAIYNGLIGATTERTMFPSALPGSYSLTDSGGGVQADSDSFSGEMTSTGLAVGGMLMLRHEFTLTGGDTATANSVFFVAPEPSGLALLVFGLIGVGITRRRR